MPINTSFSQNGRSPKRDWGAIEPKAKRAPKGGGLFLAGGGVPSRPTLGLAKPTAEGWFRWTSCGFGLAAHPPLLRRCPSRKEKRQAGASRPVTLCSCAGVPSLRGNLPVPPRPFASAGPPFRRNGRPGAVGPSSRGFGCEGCQTRDRVVLDGIPFWDALGKRSNGMTTTTPRRT